MKKIIKIRPAFDKRNSDPNKNYGIHNASMYMVLKGELGAVVFTLSTGWYLPHVADELEGRNRSMRGSGSAVSYCSPKPLQEWQVGDGRENCDWLGCTCYGDSGYSISDEVFNILVSEGSDAVWDWLKKYYIQIFGEKK